MSTLAALARLRAAEAGMARPLRRVRHYHLTAEPIVMVMYNMAGEAGAPLGCMVGTEQGNPLILTVPQPRNRELRQDFYRQLAGRILPLVEHYANTLQEIPAYRNRPARQRCAQAPQIVVPNQPTIDYLRVLGRSTRFQQADSLQHPTDDPQVGVLGRWLTFFADRAAFPGSSMLLAMTEQLTAHWATGQSALEDANLARVLAWIDPPPGVTGAQAAEQAEDLVEHPPAGPATDPAFDIIELESKTRAFAAATARGDEQAAQRVAAAIDKAITRQLQPTWDAIWQGLGLLRGLSEGARCTGRWESDLDQFTAQVQHIAAGGRPQPIRDRAVDAAMRLARMERAQLAFDDEQALDDPFVLAERRSTGTAFAGVVVSRAPDRTQLSAKGRDVLRPRFTVRTGDLPPLPQGKLASPQDLRRHVEIREVVPDGPDHHLITLELVAGMGTVAKPGAGSVPELGEYRAYTPVPEQWGNPEFPSRDDTPWTHGGPPPASGDSGPEIETDQTDSEDP